MDAPPVMAIFLITPPAPVASLAQNATERPSGEKEGLSIADSSCSATGITFDSRSDIDRKYRRAFATYTNCDPSGESAILNRPVFVNCCPSGRVTGKRVIVGAGVDGLILQTARPV